jgi:hypothetical protein
LKIVCREAVHFPRLRTNVDETETARFDMRHEVFFAHAKSSRGLSRREQWFVGERSIGHRRLPCHGLDRHTFASSQMLNDFKVIVVTFIAQSSFYSR